MNVFALVGMLMKDLEQDEKELQVYSEGCDCFSKVRSVATYTNHRGERIVLLTRDEEDS